MYYFGFFFYCQTEDLRKPPLLHKGKPFVEIEKILQNNNIQIELFIKKDDNEGTDFYYNCTVCSTKLI